MLPGHIACRNVHYEADPQDTISQKRPTEKIAQFFAEGA
jgi:hypothetical protein